MANYKIAGNTVVRIDASAGGTLTAITSYIDTISPVGKTVDALDVTAFDDTAERVIAGIELADEITLNGAFDDTATTGPDAIFATAVGTLLSFEYNPVGTAGGARRLTAEVLVTHYASGGEVKGRINWEATLKKDGTVTIGTV